MRFQDFSPDAPGQLVPLEDGCSFIPATIPPALPASWELHSLDERARGALGELAGSARNIQNEVLITRPLLTREAVESNKIENTITRAEDVLLQQAGEAPADPERAKDIGEVIRYQSTLAIGAAELERGRPLSLHLLRSLHLELLKGTRGEHRKPGEFRTENVLIGRHGDSYASARFVPPTWEHVPSLMEQFEAFIAAAPAYSPLISAAIMHYQFESIHAFLDGNGRLGRLLIPLYLISHDVVDRPIIYLSPYFERYRDDYIGLMKRVSTEAAWADWIHFFLMAVESQARDSLRRVGAITEMQERYRVAARRSGTTKATLPAVDLIMERVVVSAQDVQEYARVAYNTAKSALLDLVNLGVVEQVPDSVPQRWWARELLDVAYDD